MPTTVIRSLSPTFLEYKLRRDDDGNELASVLYEVTRADTPMLDGEQYTWESLGIAVDAAQQDIVDGAMFGYLEHQPSVYNKKGKAIDFFHDPSKRLFKVASLFKDEENKRVLSWADYLSNDLGKEMSKKIKEDGFQPSVSMTSFVSCSDSVCDVLKILNYDQVKSPNMPSAVMLSFNSSDAVKEKYLSQINTKLNQDACCDNCANQTGICLSKQDHTSIKQNNSNSLLPDLKEANSRSGQFHFYQNSRLGENKYMYIFKSKYFTERIRTDTSILSLDALYGMALGGWMTAQGIMSLGYWADCQKDSAAEAKKAPVAIASTSAEETTETTMISADSQYLNDRLVEINKAYQTNKKTDSPSFAELLDKKEDSAKPKNDQPDQISALTSQVSELAKVVTALATDSNKKEEKRVEPVTQIAVNPKAEIENHLDSLLSKDSISFQEGKIVYQKNSFDPKDIKAIRDNAVKADSKESAVSFLEFGFDQLSKHKASNFLKNKGFDMAKDGDAKPAGKTTTIQVGNENTPLEKIQNSYMNVARVTNPDLYNRIKTNKDSAKYQEKVKPLKDFVRASIDGQLKEASEYCSTQGIKTDAFDSSNREDVINKLINWFPTEANKKDYSIRKDAAGEQALVNTTVHVILPTISSAMQMEPIEQLDIVMDFYSGLGLESLDTSFAIDSPGYGRVFNFEQDFAATATGYNDDPDNLELTDDGESEFEEISSKNTRFEFVAKDYGAVLRLGRANMLALLQQNTDVFARQEFRMLEKMGRDQTTRALREPFYVSSDFGAVARTDTVANVAVSGSQAEGLRYYTGEYIRSGAGTAMLIAGKTFGGTASNIDAVVRLKGSQTSGGAIQNSPISANRLKKTRTVKGAISTESLNPITVVINAVDISAREGTLSKLSTGVTTVVDKKGATSSALWARDLDGFIVLVTGAGQGANPTSPQIVVTYSENTNIIRVNVDSSTNNVQTFWDDYLYACANTNSEMASSPNYGGADMVLLSKVMATQIRQASLFRKDNSPTGANLLSSENKITGVYDDLTYIGTNAALPFGDNRSLILKKDYCKMNMNFQSLSEFYRAQKANTTTGKVKTLDAVVADVMMQETLAVPILTHPTTSKKTGFPIKEVLHYGKLKFRQ